MENRIQLEHPAGKKAVRMDKAKYEVVKKPLLNRLKTRGESTHSEILQTIVDDFDRDKTIFEGSIEWHMEWVKLDLEARKQIKRIGDRSPVRFALV